jgi:hypothetical protein
MKLKQHKDRRIVLYEPLVLTVVILLILIAAYFLF